MEFRDDEKKKNENQEEDALQDVDEDDQDPKSKRQQMSVGFIDDTGAGSIPGEAQLSDLEAETPIAEWKVEEGAGKEPLERVHVTSDYTLSQASAGRSQVEAEVLSQGPSALTFLVAVVAGVVMIGAIFSGRE